jgi:hypothetical protein
MWSLKFLIVVTVVVMLLVFTTVSSLCLRYEKYEPCEVYGMQSPVSTWIMFCGSLASIVIIVTLFLAWTFGIKIQPSNRYQKVNARETVVKIYIPLESGTKQDFENGKENEQANEPYVPPLHNDVLDGNSGFRPCGTDV